QNPINFFTNYRFLKNEKFEFLKKINSILNSQLSISSIDNYLLKESKFNKLRLYRLLVYLQKYVFSYQLRCSKETFNLFRDENKEIKFFEEKIYKIKDKHSQKRIAILGPLDDIKDFNKELKDFDELLIINPSNKFDFENYPNTEFSFFFRTPSIEALENKKFSPPSISAKFIILERKTNKYLFAKQTNKAEFQIINNSRLINNNFLLGKLNAIQSVICHLIQMGYRDIGIYGCDLFLTSRIKNKRKDYAPYQKEEIIFLKKLQNNNQEYFQFVCHDPYINFMILKILYKSNIIKPYKKLSRILNLNYKEYLIKLEDSIKDKILNI
ncbi:hypothetical protein OAX47_01875, partial [Prochlorococcus sp. AH-736-K09]|nr:hypothetical protein [Prochlorococcus sp. AH-736-K09]